MTKDSAKDVLRALRFLHQRRAVPGPSASDGRIMLEVAGRGAIGIAKGVLDELVRRDLVRLDGGEVCLTEAGAAHVRRMMADGDGYSAQHRDMATRVFRHAGEEVEVGINLAESPLGQLARRKDRNGRPFLDPAELRAGERLRADYDRGQLMPRLGANWQAAVSSGRRDGGRGGMLELTDAAIAARQRVDHAIAAVGPELAGVLIDVCCFLKGLETVEAERGWPVRSAKIMLKSALGALSRHYEPKVPRRSHAVLHWGAEGYRPSVQAG